MRQVNAKGRLMAAPLFMYALCLRDSENETEAGKGRSKSHQHVELSQTMEITCRKAGKDEFEFPSNGRSDSAMQLFVFAYLG